MAGYDLDGSLKIADITLRPSRTQHGIAFLAVERRLPENASATCEFGAEFKQLPPMDQFEGPVGPEIHTVRNSLFCEVAGIPDVAMELLAHPSLDSNSSVLNKYALALKNDSVFSTSDLKSLALYLADKTAERERKSRTFQVGGPSQVAVLTGGRVVESPPNVPKFNVGNGLNSNEFAGTKFTCHPGQIFIATGDTLPSGTKALIFLNNSPGDTQADLTNCTQPIDGIIFHDSSFTDSAITYSGKGRLLFDLGNTITRTSLIIDPSVDIGREDVHRLICSFQWKTITHGTKDVKKSCNKN
jgi:hypothetical protein